MLIVATVSLGWELAGVALIGLVAGVLGGMLGVGGSVIMIPGLTMLLGREQHLYQAAAMMANVAVSVPAARRHYKAGAMDGSVLRWMLPAALVAVLVGVWLSNLQAFEGKGGGVWLGRVLAVFLVYVIYVNVQRLRREWRDRRRGGANDQTSTSQDACDSEGKESDLPASPGPALGVGAVMGTIAGLLGIGGGAIAVPLQQTWLRLPLRRCIANSSAVICVSASIGATVKLATLGQHGYRPTDGVWLGLVLAPTCFVGGRIGASLTHRLPVRQVRIAFVLLMLVAAWKMAAF